MILAPFGFFALSGLPPLNLAAPVIALINNLGIEYTPGLWDGALTVGYVWYADDVATGDITDVIVGIPGVDYRLVETATNLHGETSISSNTINIPGVAVEVIDNVNTSFTISGSVEPYYLVIDQVGVTANVFGSLLDLIDVTDEIAVSHVPFLPALNDAVLFDEQAGDVTWELTGTLGDSVNNSIAENGFVSLVMYGST